MPQLPGPAAQTFLGRLAKLRLQFLRQLQVLGPKVEAVRAQHKHLKSKGIPIQDYQSQVTTLSWEFKKSAYLYTEEEKALILTRLTVTANLEQQVITLLQDIAGLENELDITIT